MEKLPVYVMDQLFVAYCAANNWEIVDRKRAEGGSVYYELNHTCVFVSGVSEIRISNHPHKYGLPSYSVGDDSFEGLFPFLEKELNDSAFQNLSLQVCNRMNLLRA